LSGSMVKKIRVKPDGESVARFILPVTMLCCLLLSSGCRRSLRQGEIDLIRMFPYGSRLIETRGIGFDRLEAEEQRHLIRGWGIPRQDKDTGRAYRWALGNRSELRLCFTEINSKILRMECNPFNPRGAPSQTALVYINNLRLGELIFPKDDIYTVSVPADYIRLGSNSMSFEWKYPRSPRDLHLNTDSRKLAVRFYRLEVMSEGKNQRTVDDREIKLIRRGKVGSVSLEIPPGQAMEYYLELPKRARLEFELSAGGWRGVDTPVFVELSNEDGGVIRNRSGEKGFKARRRYTIEPGCLLPGKIRIAFGNSGKSGFGGSIRIIQPKVIFHTRDAPPFNRLFRRKSTPVSNPDRETGALSLPHVFIYLVDALRADHMGVYGYGRDTTPRADLFARDGVVFARCFATASWTKPSTGSILTGLYPYRHRAENRMDMISGEVLMLPEILREYGYRTIHITTNAYTSKAFNFHQGIDHYRMIDDWRTSAREVNREFFSVLENQPPMPEEPLYAYLHTIDPHEPYVPNKPFLKFKTGDRYPERFGYAGPVARKNRNRQLTAKDIEYLVSLYDCEIHQNDYHFGEFLDFLKDRKLYNDAIIVFVSDHGEQFGEHGDFFHGKSVYNSEIHVPLIVKFPGRQFSHREYDGIISVVDILPTLLGYLRMENPRSLDGTNLFPFLEPGGSVHRSILFQQHLYGRQFTGLITSQDLKKYLVRHQGRYPKGIRYYEMYDLKADFTEEKDLLQGASHFFSRGIRFRIDYMIEGYRAERYGKKEKVDERNIDSKTLKAMKALGYF